MDVKTLTGRYLSAINDGFEAIETPDGFAVWMPAYHSDDDGVILSVRSHTGGWLVTDDGSTMSTLISRGAATDTPAFTAAWQKLVPFTSAQVQEPGLLDDGEIAAWTTEHNLGDTLNLVALAAVRAEGLFCIREREGGERFATKIGKRVKFLLGSQDLAGTDLTKGGSITLQSGRTKKVTASIRRGSRTLAVLQAVSGRDDSSRERAFERCFTLFSRATIEAQHRFAVIDEVGAWDDDLLDDLKEVGQVLPYRSQADFDAAFAQIVRDSLGRLVPA